jgi:hypothetical protein
MMSGRTGATESGGDGTFTFIFVGEVVSWITSLTFAAENLHSVVKDEQGSGFWRYGGLVAGGLNIVGGCLWLAAGKGYGKEDATLWLAITHFTFGALDISFALWAQSQPERPKQKLTLAPMIMPDIRGRPAVGAGLSLVNW